MGWMDGKEHNSGPVIQVHSPIFLDSFCSNVGPDAFHRWEAKTFQWLFCTCLGTIIFRMEDVQGLFCNRFMLGNTHQSHLNPFPPLSIEWTNQTPLPPSLSL
ncbi:hypothetical protein NPIL_239901 [Nephila pilipes]|uniref:Uncharacterized protein n=1 Tax=Nephila pilipes TaxID=299642 RepID=A0A8X6NPD3_NEPPI|nr:hypothetical protein NPIL_239901 [Nephila pilipes]